MVAHCSLLVARCSLIDRACECLEGEGAVGRALEKILVQARSEDTGKTSPKSKVKGDQSAKARE